MKAIMVLFDSLNRHMLPPYGCDWTHAPNFARLAQRTVTFDNAFVGSMPCMPARRDLHTGRYNFLHRSWGPLEPFDESMPQILKEHGTHTHLATDHAHYFEDGGGTYHPRYSTWEFFRGHEGDPCFGQIADPPDPGEMLPHSKNTVGREGIRRQDRINRENMQWEELQPQARTFRSGIDFIRRNHDSDNWLLQLETFDPHEPFFTQNHFKDLYAHDYDGPPFDWPDYQPVEETPDQIQHCRYEYAALLSMCDAYLGRVLDTMDELDLWDDTMLIVTSDHGFLLGEHGWWAKCIQPFYSEISRIPFFIWDPRCRLANERRDSIIQWIDLPVTLLEYFGAPIPDTMQGKSLRATVETDEKIRDAAIFGIHGGHVNCTDGRYVYMCAPHRPDSSPLFNYTLMPTDIRRRFSPDELRRSTLAEPFPFTKNCPLLKIPADPWWNTDFTQFGTLLFDMQTDPAQMHPIRDPAVEARMIDHMVRIMKENDSPAEQFQRLGLEPEQ